jgi:hypothetical protein
MTFDTNRRAGNGPENRRWNRRAQSTTPMGREVGAVRRTPAATPRRVA